MKPDDDKPKPQDREQEPPDGRGERPTDPNELARWIVEQSTTEHDQDSSSTDANNGASP